MGVTVAASASPSPVVVQLTGPDGSEGPGPVNLVEGDRMIIREPDGDLPMMRIGDGMYGADLGKGTGDLQVVIERSVDQPLDFPFFVAPAFDVHAPPSASRAVPLTITWDASTGPYKVELQITDGVAPHCISPALRELSFDVGSYTFNPFELAFAGDQGSCTATVIIKRTTLGAPNLAATQTRTASFESVP